MSGLELLAPLGIVALLGIPLVILFHMRHTTPLVRPVPTLRFWLQAIEQHTEHARFRRPPVSLLLLLQLIAVGLIGFALTRPAVTDAWGGLGHRTEPRHVILLLDGSTSMSAIDTPSGRTRFEEARAAALARLGELREGDVATVVLLGTHPSTFEATDAAGLKALRDRLGGLDPPGGRADLNAALRLSKDLLLPGLDDQVVLVSDGARSMAADPAVVADLGAPVEFVRIGRSNSANLAVTDVSARAAPDTPGQQQLYARIVNFGDAATTATVVVAADGIEVERRDVELVANGGDEEFVVRELPAGASRVTISIDEAGDPFAADDGATLVLTRDADVGLRILLVSDLPNYLQRALAVLPGAQLTTVSTSEMLTGEVATNGYDLVVYEGFVPPDAAYAAAPILLVGPPRDGPIPTRGVMTTPTATTIRANDPLLNGVELSGVIFGETPVHVLDATQTAIVSAEAGPLIYRGMVPGGGQPMIVMTFDVTLSNLPRRVAFPILVANIAGELAPSPLPPAAPLGEPLSYRARPETTTVRITPPGSEPIELSVGGELVDELTDEGAGAPTRSPEVVFADTGRPGEYRVEELDINGEVVGGGTFVVNAGHPRESDLRANDQLPGVLATARAVSAEDAGSALSDLWPTLVAVALAVLGFEWLWSVIPRRRDRRWGVASR